MTQDKREEEYQKQRDEVQALFAKVGRRVQGCSRVSVRREEFAALL